MGGWYFKSLVINYLIFVVILAMQMVEVETLGCAMTWQVLSYAVGQRGKIVVGV
jgi:hypothetical protein